MFVLSLKELQSKVKREKNMTGTHKDGFKRLNEENQRLRERKYVFTKMKLLRKWPAVIKDL